MKYQEYLITSEESDGIFGVNLWNLCFGSTSIIKRKVFGFIEFTNYNSSWLYEQNDIINLSLCFFFFLPHDVLFTTPLLHLPHSIANSCACHTPAHSKLKG